MPERSRPCSAVNGVGVAGFRRRRLRTVRARSPHRHLVCGAAALLVLGAAVLRETVVIRQLRQRGTHTQGVVVDNVRTTDSGGPMWVPVIAFTDRRRYAGAGWGWRRGGKWMWCICRTTADDPGAHVAAHGGAGSVPVPRLHRFLGVAVSIALAG